MFRYYQRIRYLMGSPFEIMAYGEREICDNGIEAAFNEIARLERLLSIYQENSEISRINRGETSVDPNVQEILALSMQYKEMTHGAFDIEYGGSINLGAIGKGYAIDKGVAILKDFGITRAKISCRSTIYGLGAPHGKAGWQVTIEGREESPILLYNQAISTSSNAEQFGHIIAPKMGVSAEGCLSATVLSQSAVQSDAFSTAAFVLGAEEGIKLLERLYDAEGLILSFHGERSVTSGWPRKEGCTRRKFLTKAASFLLFIFFAPRLGRAAVVYQTEDQALKKMMPDADRFDTKEITLTADQQLQAEQITGKRLSDSHLRYNMATKGEGIIGYAFPIEVIGKERPITLLIGVTKEGTIMAVEVLIYRESQGSEIRYPRFMAQFRGKKKEDPLRMGEDIQSISGATLSSRGVTYGVKKALALYRVIPK